MPAHKSVFINNVVTPKGRFSFPHLEKPDVGGQYSDDKYKVTILIDKAEDLTAIKKAIMQCAKEAWPGKNIKPKDLAHLPLRDGDEKEHLDGYPGNYFITAKSKKRRRCVDARRNDIDPSEVYGGCYGRLVLTAMSYEQGGKPGVTFLLDIVQKLEDGESFGGGGANVDVLDDGAYDDLAAADDGGDLDGWGDEDDGPEAEDDWGDEPAF